MHKMTESMQTGLLDIQVLKSWVFSQRSLNILFFCSSTGDGRKVQGTFTDVEVRYSPSLERGAERRWMKGPGGYPIKLLHFCVIYNVATQKICVM